MQPSHIFALQPSIIIIIIGFFGFLIYAVVFSRIMSFQDNPSNIYIYIYIYVDVCVCVCVCVYICICIYTYMYM